MQPTGQLSPDGYWMWNGTQWVPNPYRPMAPPPVARPYESAAFRGRVASILVGATALGTVFLTAASLAIDLIPNPDQNQSVIIGFVALLALLTFFGPFIVAVVFFCMWLHRVVGNMPALGAPDPRWSPARSVVYCFIPFVWLFHPLWSVLDAWRGSDISRRWLDVGSRKLIRPPIVLAGWWTSWLVGNYALNIGSRLSGTGAAVLDVIGGAGTVIAALLCILVIRNVTDRQERKNYMIASGQLV